MGDDLYPEVATAVNLGLDLSGMAVNLAENFLTIDNASPLNVRLIPDDVVFPPIATHTLGTLIITKPSAASISIPAPVPGLPKDDGDDGTTLRILASTQFAHVLHFPTNTIRVPGAFKSNITMIPSGTLSQSVLLVAYQGIWYVYSITNGSAS